MGVAIVTGAAFFFRRNATTRQLDSALTLVVEEPPQAQSTVEPGIFYPMTRYEKRLTVRWYGKDVRAEEAATLPCADPFVGFHTADDLEVKSDELALPLSVFAMADGTVRQVDHVNGYGGLIVLEHLLNGETVTTYYGHIDTGTTTLEEGDPVSAGEKIAELADHCSADSSNERKHLHFGIHNDADIDVRGYVQTKEELSGWVNPKDFLKSLNAVEPPE